MIEGRDIAEPRVEGAAVAPRVPREDRLPDGGAELTRRGGLPEDVRVDVVEGPPHLVAGREEMRGLVGAREAHAAELEIVPEVAPERRVRGDPPAGVVGAPGERIERRLVPLVEPVEDEVLVEARPRRRAAARRRRGARGSCP